MTKPPYAPPLHHVTHPFPTCDSATLGLAIEQQFTPFTFPNTQDSE